MKIIFTAILLFFAMASNAQKLDSAPVKEASQIVTNVSVPSELKLSIDTRTLDSNKLYGLSDTAVVGLGAALITLISTLVITWMANSHSVKLQNGSNAHALKLQEEANNQKIEEAESARKFTMRQELYLKSIGTSLAMNKFFIDYLRQVDPNDIGPFLEFNKIISEVQLVGDDQTIAASFRLQREVGEKYFEIMKYRMVIDEARNKGLNTVNAVVEADINRLSLTMLKDHKELRKLQVQLQWNMKRELGVNANLAVMEAEVEKSGNLAVEVLEKLMTNE